MAVMVFSVSKEHSQLLCVNFRVPVPIAHKCDDAVK